jgi:GGDEF domain-containing protein
MIIAIFSYYTGVTFSLLLTLIADFTYSSYNLYLSFAKGLSIGTEVYFWIIVIPLTAVVVSLLSRHILALQLEYNSLEVENKSLVMIDSLTGIRNSIALFNELPIYMSMSKRYKIPITLMLVRFKYGDRLRNILGESGFKDVIINVSDILNESLRVEDRKYILKDEITFAFILISDDAGCKIVKNRFKENLNKLNMDNLRIFKNIKPEVQVGYYIYNEEIIDAFDFLDKAEKEIEYDI